MGNPHPPDLENLSVRFRLKDQVNPITQKSCSNPLDVQVHVLGIANALQVEPEVTSALQGVIFLVQLATELVQEEQVEKLDVLHGAEFWHNFLELNNANNPHWCQLRVLFF